MLDCTSATNFQSGVTYSWKKDDTAIVDGVANTYTGTQTIQLTIKPKRANNGDYKCVVAIAGQSALTKTAAAATTVTFYCK